MTPNVIRRIVSLPDGDVRYIPHDPRYRPPELRTDSIKASAVAGYSQQQIDDWVRKELAARDRYEAQVCSECAKTGRHCATFCRPKSKAKSLDDMTDDELVDHMFKTMAGIVEATAATQDVISQIERHRRARKSQGRGISARDRKTLEDCQVTVRQLTAAGRNLVAFAKSLLEVDAAIKASKAAPLDFEGVKAQMVEVEATMKMAAEAKSMIRRAIERRAMFFDFSTSN